MVIKIGSTVLSASPAGRPAAIADEISALRGRRMDAVIVSSGAISLGSQLLGLSERPTKLPLLQAAAAVGQSRLMQNWEHGFAAHGLCTGQILLTHHDIANRQSFLNARLALRALLNAGIVPVVNENDTVAVDEIKYGDNDLLAALVANLVSADALVILTDVNGLYNGAPDRGGVRVPVVHDVDNQATPLAAGPAKAGYGSGGMASKVKAAKAAGRHGVFTYVVKGDEPGIIASALTGADVGTLFVPSHKRLSARKHWLAYGAKPEGGLVVDTGAQRAIAREGRSVLPAGVTEVIGSFQRGDIVSVVDRKHAEFARGLALYPAGEMRKLIGLPSHAIKQALGYKYVDEVIHRDDLVLL